MNKEYKYPKTLEELKDGDLYEKQFPMLKDWSEVKVYRENMCQSRKNYLRFLIAEGRLRVIVV